MKFVGALAFTMIAAWLAATPAAATTVDFSGVGTADGDHIDSVVTSDGVFHFATDPFSAGAYYVRYRQTPDYSGDQALYPAYDGGTFTMAIDANPGVVFTSFTFDFGGQPNQSLAMRYFVATWPSHALIANDVFFFVDGATGGLVTLTNLNLTGILLEFASSKNVGLRSVSYTVAAPVATTPIPGAVVLLGTGLAGLGALARRKRGAAKGAIRAS
jgi:hypothetical protein